MSSAVRGAAVHHLGALVSLLTAVVVFAPGVLVSGTGGRLGDYFAGGPFGLTAVGVLAGVAVVVFLSIGQEHTDTVLLSGVVAVVGVAVALLAAVWAVTLDANVLFSFPPEYAWLATHRWLVVVAGALVGAVAAVQAWRVV